MTQQIRTFVSPAEDPGSQFPKFSSGQLTGYTPSPRVHKYRWHTHTYTQEQHLQHCPVLLLALIVKMKLNFLLCFAHGKPKPLDK